MWRAAVQAGTARARCPHAVGDRCAGCRFNPHPAFGPGATCLGTQTGYHGGKRHVLPDDAATLGDGEDDRHRLGGQAICSIAECRAYLLGRQMVGVHDRLHRVAGGEASLGRMGMTERTLAANTSRPGSTTRRARVPSALSSLYSQHSRCGNCPCYAAARARPSYSHGHVAGCKRSAPRVIPATLPAAPRWQRGRRGSSRDGRRLRRPA